MTPGGRPLRAATSPGTRPEGGPRAPFARRAAAALGALGLLLAVAALLPSGTSAAWQDQVYFDAGVEILPGVAPTLLSAGEGFTCTLVSGDMWCWGEGSDGQLGVGGNADADVPVAGTLVPAAAAQDAGISPASVLTEGATTDVSAGKQYACGAAGGVAYCWGAGGGRLGNYDITQPWEAPARNVPTAVYAQPAGTGFQFESPLFGQTVVTVVAGDYITCALTAVGTGACWGQGVGLTRPPSPSPQEWANAPIPLPTSAQDPASQLPPGAAITSLSTDFQNACFVADGLAYCWGRNVEGELGTGDLDAATAPVRVAQGAMPAGAVVQETSSGVFHTCAVADGAAYCWGLRGGDLIGDDGGQTGAQTVPSAVVGLDGKTIVEVSAGAASSCALDSAGQAYCWGSNQNGRLGTTAVPTFGTAPVPVPVEQPAGVLFTSISVGTAHACAIAEDESVYCWGAAGTLGNGPGQADSPLPVVVTPTWAAP